MSLTGFQFWSMTENTNTARGGARALPAVAALAGLCAVAAVYRAASGLTGWHKADAVTLGLMADDIAHGRAFPLVYYGQYYMGSIEAWITAPLFMIAGPTWWGLSFAQILVAALGVLAFYHLGKSVAGSVAGLAAALLWAVCPFTAVYYGVTPRGCYMEVVCGGAILLWAAVERWKGRRFSPAASALAGVLAGLLLWTSLLSVPFIAVLALAVVAVDGRKVFNAPNAAMAVGFAAGAAPFIAMIFHVTESTAGRAGLGKFGERLAALAGTYRDVFLPFGGHEPGAALVILGWFALGALTVATLFAMGLSVVSSGMGPGGVRWRAALPLTVFIALFLGLYVLNENSLARQTRYLLPLLVPVFALAGAVFAMVYRRWKAPAILALCAILAANFTATRFAADSIARGNEAGMNRVRGVFERIDALGVESVVYPDYNAAHQLSFEAMTRGSKLRAMDMDGARSGAITTAVERDAGAAVITPLPEETVARLLAQCCDKEFRASPTAGGLAVYGMSPARGAAESIPPDEWIVPENAIGAADRKFSTTIASGGSFTIELKEPHEVSRVRVVFGSRKPDSLSLKVSEDGESWTVAAPDMFMSFFVPYGPKVFIRSVLDPEREHHEWNFPPVRARYVRFEMSLPPGAVYDIHEIFIYAPSPGSAREPSMDEAGGAARRGGVDLLAANRWFAAHMAGSEEFAVIRPSLRPLHPRLATSKLRAGPGLGAIVENGDLAELESFLASRGMGYHKEELGKYALVALRNGGGDLWWTGFTLIEY